MRLSLTVLK